MNKIALISVSNKNGIVEFAKYLIRKNYDLISTSGTYKLLIKNNIKVTSIETITGFPEILDGRVKTLHPKIHGGLLANLDLPNHKAQIKDNQINKIDLLIVNLYPFYKKILEEASDADIIENIDIGGPAMLRSASKNYKFNTVICDPEDYPIVKAELEKNNNITIGLRQKLAGKAFSHCANYDSTISAYFKRKNNISWHKEDTIPLFNKTALRYGENANQEGLVFNDLKIEPNSILNAEQLWGKKLSYNNLVDSDAAINIINEFADPCVVSLKHTNSCGIASDKDINKAWTKCYESDPISIFGGIIILNRPMSKYIATAISKIFVEIVIAPNFSDRTLEILKKRKSLRILKLKVNANSIETINRWKFKSINGGMLVQERDQTNWKEEFKNLKCVTKAKYKNISELEFAWKVVKHLKSNAIALTNNNQLLGIGVGQTSRIRSVQLALSQKLEIPENSIIASDAFFPMKDAITAIADYQVKVIIQPGGSINDQKIIDECNKHNIAMYFVGKRHFLH